MSNETDPETAKAKADDAVGKSDESAGTESQKTDQQKAPEVLEGAGNDSGDSETLRADEEPPLEPSENDELSTDDRPTDETGEEPTEEDAGHEEILAEAPSDDGPADAHESPHHEDAAATEASNEPEPTEAHHDDHHETHHSSFASTVLMLLIGAIFVSGLTLWGAPKIAPYLPASLAKYLAPASQTAQAEISEIKERLSAVEELRGRVAVLEALDVTAITSGISSAQAQADGNQTAISDIALQLSDLSEQLTSSGASGATLTTQLDTLSSEVTALRSDLETLQGAVDDAEAQASGSIPVTEDLQAAVAGLTMRLNSVDEALTALPDLATKSDLAPLASSEALDATRATLAAEIAAVGAIAVAAQETGTLALNEAQSSQRGSAIRGVSTELRTLIAQGSPYLAALTDLEEISGTPAPGPLAAGAQAGLPTISALREAFPPAARSALEADQQPVGGGGTVARISAWLGSQVSVRPTQPIAGSSTGAVLSRVEAAMRSGDAAKALTEAGDLSETASAAMSDWLSQLALKVEAEAALGPYIAAIGGES
ncbi:MAG: hypothetical protein AAGE80_02490 [Pseudomonadota bacterium]